MNNVKKDKTQKKRKYTKPELIRFGKIKNLVAGGTNLPEDPAVPGGTRHN